MNRHQLGFVDRISDFPLQVVNHQIIVQAIRTGQPAAICALTFDISIKVGPCIPTKFSKITLFTVSFFFGLTHLEPSFLS
ncbi:MAG: hypothetical protein EZS28_017200 [Streblomastix strix]|uniref:Uncharacterized protein n=1 Tax=Streblomastix strix TaxID=222440 RepID=A0A5J4VXL9_9EUKA|nr:MAG: hypothetical protein EZS28_017200 [Streblomastix strix]